MNNFDFILNWKLLKGSHQFPGGDGGTCINEAAIVAAGFGYRAVRTANDCPPCFSLPVAAYAIALNDRMPDDLRQSLLLPFVTRLAGTADTLEIEKSRTIHIAVETVRRLLPVALRALGLKDEARQCKNITTPSLSDHTAARAVAAAASAADAAYASAASAADAAYSVRSADAAAYAVAAYAETAARGAACAYAAVKAAASGAYADAAVQAADAASNAAAHAAYGADAKVAVRIWQITVDILDEAIRLGKEAAPIEINLVKERMQQAKTCGNVKVKELVS